MAEGVCTTDVCEDEDKELILQSHERRGGGGGRIRTEVLPVGSLFGFPLDTKVLTANLRHRTVKPMPYGGTDPYGG